MSLKGLPSPSTGALGMGSYVPVSRGIGSAQILLYVPSVFALLLCSVSDSASDADSLPK